MTILDIPYVSQEDEGADINGKEIYNDCGPTCGTMLIRAYTPDKTFTVNQFYDDLVGMGVKKKEGNTHRLNLQKVLEKHGISSSWNHSLKMSDLETSINEKRPPIALLSDHGGRRCTIENRKEGRPRRPQRRMSDACW